MAGGAYCRVRLDRALATVDWRTRFPGAVVNYLTAAGSDHEPILLVCAAQGGREQRRYKPTFRYEVMWETHSEFLSVMQQLWSSGGPASSLQDLEQKLAAVAGSLGSWSVSSFGQVRE